MVPRKRKTVSGAVLDRYLTRQLHKTVGFPAVCLSAGYRLRVPDADGCNWSGDVVAISGTHTPPPQTVAAASRLIARAAQKRFNLSD